MGKSWLYYGRKKKKDHNNQAREARLLPEQRTLKPAIIVTIIMGYLQLIHMKLKNRISIIIALSTCCLIMFSCDKPKSHVYGKDPFPEVTLPVFSDAFQVNHVINRPTGAKSVHYRVKIKWPAQQLIAFYNSEFNKMGLLKYSNDNYGGGGWRQFMDATPKGRFEANRYFETWVDKNHNIRLLLLLDYKGTKNLSEVSVVCQVNKFFDFTRLNEFEEKLRKLNKAQEFHAMIGKYSKRNHELDIEQALKENPDNKELREYVELLKQFK